MEAKIKLEHIFKLQEILRLSKLLPIHLFEALVLQAYESIQFACILPGNEAATKELDAFASWLNRTSKVADFHFISINACLPGSGR